MDYSSRLDDQPWQDEPEPSPLEEVTETSAAEYVPDEEEAEF